MNPITHKTRRSALCALATLLTLAAAGAAADSRPNGFEMKAVMDRHHGSLILAGDYERAIDRNRTWALAITRNDDPSRRFPFSASTNLCVAHTMAGHYDQAKAFCDAAVYAARTDAHEGRRDIDYAARWAAALSNRGVLRSLTGDVTGARVDFIDAIDTSESSQAVANLARLEDSQPTLAGN